MDATNDGPVRDEDKEEEHRIDPAKLDEFANGQEY